MTKYKGLTIPLAFEDYIEDTEQDASNMTLDEMIKEAEWVYYQESDSKQNDPDGYGSTYTIKQIDAVKKFADKLKQLKQTTKPA